MHAGLVVKRSRILSSILRHALLPRGLRMVRLIERFVPAGARVVDIGCGHGHVVELLKRRGNDAVGVDLVDMSLFKAVVPTVTDGDRLPFRDNEFDVALLMTMLHHTPDPDALIAEAARVAGRLVIVEDVPLGALHMRVIKAMDSLLNLEFKGHPHTNRDDAGWRAAFARLGLAVVGTSVHWEYGVMRQVAYDLRVLGAETLLVGEVPVHWLAKAVPVPTTAVDRKLGPDEQAYAAKLKVQSRRDEYLRARWLIRSLTSHTGVLPRSEAGIQAWPPGLVGSITHKEGHVGVALLPAKAARSIGVDAEAVKRMQPEFAARVCIGAEQSVLEGLASATQRSFAAWLTVAFSFKEALFKAHYPLGETMFHFADVEISKIEPTDVGGRVTAKLLVQTSPTTPKGTIVVGSFVWQEMGADGLYVIATVMTI